MSMEGQKRRCVITETYHDQKVQLYRCRMIAMMPLGWSSIWLPRASASGN